MKTLFLSVCLLAWFRCLAKLIPSGYRTGTPRFEFFDEGLAMKMEGITWQSR